MSATTGTAASSTQHVVPVCTTVTAACPVEATVLGYAPNLGASVFFSVAFGICLIASLVLGIRKKTWTYCIALSIGLFLEILGYVGRGLMHANPWSDPGFQMQISCIILAPSFVCVSVYLTLKHVAMHINPSLSRIPPKWYPRFFLTADFACISVQGIGGGVASAADADQIDLANTGNSLLIAGIAIQVAILIVFGVLGADYLLRARKYVRSAAVSPEALALWNQRNFTIFIRAVAIAYLAILIRCVYRIAEMAGGWGNKIMQDEPSFMVLDSSFMLVACVLLTVVHPGIFFPQMATQLSFKKAKKGRNEKHNGGGDSVELTEDPTFDSGNEASKYSPLR